MTGREEALGAELQQIDDVTDSLLEIADKLEDEGSEWIAGEMRSHVSRIWGAAQFLHEEAVGAGRAPRARQNRRKGQVA